MCSTFRPNPTRGGGARAARRRASVRAAVRRACAAGLTGRTMRRHLLDLAHNPGEVWRCVTGARAVPWSQFLGAGFGNPLAVDAGKFYDACLGELLPGDFSDLKIPFTAVATDLHAREALLFTAGPLRPAVAAAMAVPGLRSEE